MSDLCRLCLKKSELFGFTPITSADGLLRNLPKMLRECMSIEVSDTEPPLFSKYICQDCLFKLELFATFRETALKNQEYYYGLLLYFPTTATCSSTEPVAGNDCVQYCMEGQLQPQQPTTSQVAHSNQQAVDDAQHHQILADINFTGNEFMMDESEKSQLNRDYDDIMRSLQKEDLDFTTNGDDFEQHGLEMSIHKNEDDKYSEHVVKQGLTIQPQDEQHLVHHRPEEQLHPLQTATQVNACFDPYVEIGTSITTQESMHRAETTADDNDISYDDFVGLKTPSDGHQESSISDIQVQRLSMDPVHAEDHIINQTMIPGHDASQSIVVSSTIELDPQSVQSIRVSDDSDDGFPQPSVPETVPGSINRTTEVFALDGKTCDVCFKTFHSRQKLKVHRNTHLRLAAFKCSFDGCSKAFKSRIGLEEHLARHTNTFEFFCDICSKGFQNRSYLSAHRRAHNLERHFQCNLCEQTYKSKQALQDHQNRHLGLKPFSCDQCDKQFTNKSLLQAHIQQHHRAEVRYPCEECGKSFTSRSYLTVHRKIHRNERAFICEVCNKAHLTRKDLEIHMTKHTGLKPYVCEICGKDFARRNAMYSHRRTHTKERPYSCDICGQSFSQHTPLQVHRRMHLGTGNTSLKSQEQQQPQQQLQQHHQQQESFEWICTMCTISFSTEQSLDAHIRAEHTQ